MILEVQYFLGETKEGQLVLKLGGGVKEPMVYRKQSLYLSELDFKTVWDYIGYVVARPSIDLGSWCSFFCKELFVNPYGQKRLSTPTLPANPFFQLEKESRLAFFFGLLVIFDNLVVLLSPLQKRVSKGCEMITLAQNSIYDLLKVRGTQKRRCQQCNLWCLQGIQPILMLLPQHRQVYMVNQVIQWLFLEARCRSQRACRLIIYQVILILIIYLRSAQLTKMRDISTQSMNESI